LKVIPYFVLIVLIAATIAPVESLNKNDVKLELENTFILIQKVEQNGGEVNHLVAKLNTAVVLLDLGSEANVTRASSIISEVVASIPPISTTANQLASMSLINTVVSLVILGILGLLVWVYGSRFYWGLWLRIHGDWKVERS
jgi:hypothetical protein